MENEKEIIKKAFSIAFTWDFSSIEILNPLRNKIRFENIVLGHNLSLFNSFLANVPILYPLKTLENQRFHVKEIFDFFILWTIQSTFKVVTSWWVLAHEIEYKFKYISWIINHMVIKLNLTDLTDLGNISRKHSAL